MRDLPIKLAKTLRHYARRALKFTRAQWWSVRRRHAERPIFVVGCSRAGTTLVYKTLSQSREIGSLQRETHDFWVDLHPLVSKQWSTHGLSEIDASLRDQEWVSRYFYQFTGRYRWVDKNNQNGLCVPYLHALFPDAYFVYVKRSPGDNLNSLIEGWTRPEEFATWSDDLPVKINIEGRYRQWCFFLAEGWQDYLDRPLEDVCAFQYRALNAAVLDARAGIAPSYWVELFYEDILRDPVVAFRRVFEQCSLTFNDRLESHCRQVLDTPYNAFSSIRLDKWRDGRFSQAVERALPQVADVARRMGYEM